MFKELSLLAKYCLRPESMPLKISLHYFLFEYMLFIRFHSFILT